MDLKLIKKRDLILLCALLLAALVLWLAYSNTRPQGNVAVVSIGFGDEMRQEIISLDENKTYTIEAVLPVTLVVEDGTIRFVDSQCPDHICENTGKISREGESATCVPAQVSVRVEERG